MKGFFIISFFVFLTVICGTAQDNLVVKYRVLNHDSDWGDLVEKEMTLVANANRSLYFNAMSLYVDSCKSTPEGAAKLREIQMKAWRVEQPDGPWKLHGLPGVILSADGGDGFIIEAKEVGVTAKDIPHVYSVNEYEKVERRKILADHEHFENNFEALMSAEGLSLNADGSPADIPKYNRNQRAWETDY